MRRHPVTPAKPDVQGARRMLARNTHRLRSAIGMTQLEASERAGLDSRQWQRVEHEASNATLNTLARVAAALDTSIAELFAPPR